MTFAALIGGLTAALAVTSSHGTKRVSTYLCEGSTINTGDDPHVIAHATAYAFAEAVAHASIDCQITGVGSVKAQAHAKAEKKAKVWLKAWAQAVSVAEVCEKCFTYATATVDILEKVLLHAVAEVYISVDEKNDNPNTVPCRSIKDITAEDYKHHLVDATVTAFAEAIATAVDHEDGVYCESQVDVAVSTPYSNAECWSTTNVHDDNSYHSYIVTASLEASIESCSPEGYSEASAELSARGVASAVARAFGSVLGGCDTGGKGYACVENYGWIETISIATAEATAEAWVDAMDCDCEIDTELFVHSLGGVISEAALELYTTKCRGGGKSINQNKFKRDFEKLSVKAIAKVFLDVHANGDGCKVELTGETSVCQCMPKWKSCVEDGKVLGCCNDNFSCIKNKKKGDHTAKCRRNKALKKRWNVALPQTCGAH